MQNSKALTLMVMGAAAGYALLSTQPADATMNFGRLSVVPSLGVSQEYNDNIYLKKTNEQSDALTHISPNLKAEYTFAGDRGEFGLDYQGDWAFYRDTASNNYSTHDLTASLGLELVRGFKITIENDLLGSSDPYGSKATYGVGSTKSRWSNGLAFAADKDIAGNNKVSVYYNQYRQEWDQKVDDQQDFIEHEFGVGLSRRVAPDTWGFIRYHHGTRDYEWREWTGLIAQNDSDSRWDRVNFGANWDRGSKLSGEFNIGYEWTSFDSAISHGGQPMHDDSSWIAGTAVTYRVTPKTATTIGINKSIETFSGDSNVTYDYAEYTVGLDTNFTKQFSAGVALQLTTADHSDGLENRDYGVTLQAEYAINRWLAANLKYTHVNRDSNNATKEYTANRYFIGFTASR